MTESPGAEGALGKGVLGKRSAEGQASTVLGHVLSLGTWHHVWSPFWKLTGPSCCRRSSLPPNPGRRGISSMGRRIYDPRGTWWGGVGVKGRREKEREGGEREKHYMVIWERARQDMEESAGGDGGGREPVCSVHHLLPSTLSASVPWVSSVQLS